MEASAPRIPQVHLLETALGGNLFVADGSRLFAAGLSLYSRFESAIQDGNSNEISSLLDKVGLGGSPLIDDEPLSNPAIHALSLAIAQKCNLGCTYCYAQQGEFGGAGKNMPLAEATRSRGTPGEWRREGREAEPCISLVANRWSIAPFCRQQLATLRSWLSSSGNPDLLLHHHKRNIADRGGRGIL